MPSKINVRTPLFVTKASIRPYELTCIIFRSHHILSISGSDFRVKQRIPVTWPHFAIHDSLKNEYIGERGTESLLTEIRTFHSVPAAWENPWTHTMASLGFSGFTNGIFSPSRLIRAVISTFGWNSTYSTLNNILVYKVAQVQIPLNSQATQTKNNRFAPLRHL